MAFDGRTLVFPQALSFGARPLPVPGRGHVMCVSALLPFRLADGAPVRPSDYFEAVSTHGGKDVAPDSMAPLPGSEVLVLGPATPVSGDEREAELRCGTLRCRLLLRPDPDAPDAPLRPGPEEAAWHEEDNPFGRGGPGDDRRPLIVLPDRPDRPVWLGATPFLHPARTRLMGVSDRLGAGGWPADASPSVLHEAHPAFWTDSLYPGDPLRITGLCREDVDVELPPYRPNLASSRAPDGRWIAESARIHTLVLLPAAALGAVIWRASIALGSDPIGETVTALVFALEDPGAPERDEQDLAEIAAVRWLNPVAALDDRPLLPAAMAAAAAPPQVDASAFGAQHAAAEEWARKETGMGDFDPFGEPDVVKELGEAANAGSPTSAQDLDALAGIGRKAMEDSKRRHEEAGFEEPDLESLRAPLVRGDALDAEIEERLGAPYRAPHEVAIATSLTGAPPEARANPEETLNKLAAARVTATEPVLFWPAMTDAEGERFGEKALERLRAADPERHIDISGAVLAATPGDGMLPIDGRTFDGLLAEETTWRGIEFRDCAFRDSSFVKARFEDCVFARCTFEGVNCSLAGMERVVFRDCELARQVLHGMSWVDLRFEHCILESITFMDWAVRDTVFEGGRWEQVQVNESLLVSVVFRDMAHREVVWMVTHAPYTRFERVTLFKVWVSALGFPESVFDSVEADTCGFLGEAHFKDGRFTGTRFLRTGFTRASFSGARFDSGCAFDRCDFTSAVFAGARLVDVRFLGCSMTSTVWAGGVDASGAWFLGCILRGVDFMDTRLMNAVFTDSDLEGTSLDDDLALGADFRGTMRGSG